MSTLFHCLVYLFAFVALLFNYTLIAQPAHAQNMAEADTRAEARSNPHIDVASCF